MKLERKQDELILHDTPFFMRSFIAILTVIMAMLGVWCFYQAFSVTNYQKSTEILFGGLFALFLTLIGTAVFFSLPKKTFRLNSLNRKALIEEFSLLNGRKNSEYDFNQILCFRDSVRDAEGFDSTIVVMILKDNREVQVSHSAGGFSEVDHKNFVKMANFLLNDASNRY